VPVILFPESKKISAEFIDKGDIANGIDFHNDGICVIDNMAVFNLAFVQALSWVTFRF